MLALTRSGGDKVHSSAIGADGSLSYSGEMAFDDAQSAVMSANGDLCLQRTSSGSGLYFAARIPGTVRYDWDLGADGKRSSTSPTSDVTFSKAGIHQVTLAAADSAGCSGDLFYTGQSAACSANAAAKQTVTIDTAPWIESLKVSPSKVTSKTKIKFALTESASVSFYAQKPIKGRTVGTKCKKQTARNKKAKKCTLWVRASKTFRANGKAGRTNSLKFTGKVGKAKLAKGSYRLYAVATDSAKGKGPAKTASFKIKSLDAEN